uniref:Reticulon-4-interacting protein 1 homolog, mitochondrial-like n=1 Tax=Poecilia reticulata TaxID=8081 RepID=A0A3P9NJ03_POERE
MASVRLLCLFNGKAAGWSKTLARTGCRNVCSSPSRLQSMSAWVIDQYGSSGVLRHTEEIPIPTVNFAHDVMINVSAASLNPLDLNMRGGYGATLLNLRRDPLSVVNGFSEFPLILGRDLSGVVVDCGSGVTHFAPGDEVSCKPKSLSHIEAASIPYVANTAFSALVYAGGLCRESSLNKRVLITGASGGVGTFSIQLLKAWGAHVTVTCSQNAEGLVRGLGADEAVDYTAGDVAEQLEMMERFDVILDNVGGDTEEWATRLLKPWSGAKYVTLVSPLLLNTDSMGLLDGSLHAGLTLHNKAFQNIASSGVFYRWAFYAPDGPTLDEVSRLVDAGKILPVVEAQFPFSQVPQAFQKLEQGHARGKTVVEVAEDAEYTESEQKVQETTLQQN